MEKETKSMKNDKMMGTEDYFEKRRGITKGVSSRNQDFVK